jgi:Lon protease-like protein
MQIPLFPLHTVLAPGIALPLHIFEERYRQMVRHCLDTSSPFGVVLIRGGSEVAPRDGTPRELAIAGVGTTAEIREASRYADGRWDLLIVGTSRFVVRDVHTDVAAYLVAEVDPFPDTPVDDVEATETLAGRVTRRFVDYLRLLQPRDGESADPIDVQMEVETEVDEIDAGDDDEDEGTARGETDVPILESDPVSVPIDDPEAATAALRIPDDPSALSFLLTGIVQVEPDRRQALLEASGADERLRDIDALLDREILLLGARLAPFAVDRSALAGSDN